MRCCRRGEFSKLFWFSLAVVLVWGGIQPAKICAQLVFIPELNVDGRYDSNIFVRPKQLLPQGTTTSDFVAVTGGALAIAHENRDFDAKIRIGGEFNTYVQHTNLNYASMKFDGGVNLDRWVDRYVRGANLSVHENFRYTPEPPGFLTGSSAITQSDVFFSGIQGFRARSYINTTDIKGNYPVSRDLALEGGYTFGLRNVGRLQGGDVPGVAGVNYFNTITHTWFGGPRYKLTQNDSITAIYRQMFFSQANSQGGRTFASSLITFAGGYTKVFPEWTVNVEGGLTFTEPVGRTFPSGSLHITTRPERDTVLNIILSREGRPSFFVQGGAAINNRGQIGISHRIYERLTVEGFVGYSLIQLFPDTSKTAKNLTATSRLRYKLTRNISGDVFYMYTNIDNEFSSLQYQVSRNQVGFILSAEWN